MIHVIRIIQLGAVVLSIRSKVIRGAEHGNSQCSSRGGPGRLPPLGTGGVDALGLEPQQMVSGLHTVTDGDSRVMLDGLQEGYRGQCLDSRTDA